MLKMVPWVGSGSIQIWINLKCRSRIRSNSFRIHSTDFYNFLILLSFQYKYYHAERSTFAGWAKRAELALALLDLLQELDVMFESPVHLCDIKPEHFGLSEGGRVKVLDLDSVYLKPLADRSMGELGGCRQHADCDIFDCRGQCDLVRGRCVNGAVNNNLQVGLTIN